MKTRLRETGYYWFRAGEDSPSSFARDNAWRVVEVGCNEDENSPFIYVGGRRWDVKEVGGTFSGRIPEPDDCW